MPAHPFRTEPRQLDVEQTRRQWARQLDIGDVQAFRPAEKLIERFDHYLRSNQKVEALDYSEMIEGIFHPDERATIFFIQHFREILRKTPLIGPRSDRNIHEMAQLMRHRVEREARAEGCLWTPLLDEWARQAIGLSELKQGRRDDINLGREIGLLKERWQQIKAWVREASTETMQEQMGAFSYWQLTALKLGAHPYQSVDTVLEEIRTGGQQLKQQEKNTSHRIFHGWTPGDEVQHIPFFTAAMGNHSLDSATLDMLWKLAWEEAAPQKPWEATAEAVFNNPNFTTEQAREFLGRYGGLPSRGGVHRTMGGQLAQRLLKTRLGQQEVSVRGHIYMLSPRGVVEKQFQKGEPPAPTVLRWIGRQNPETLLAKLQELQPGQLQHLSPSVVAPILDTLEAAQKQQAFRLLAQIKDEPTRSSSGPRR